MDKRSEDIFALHKEAILDEAAKRYGVTGGDLVKRGSFESQVFEFVRDGKAGILKLTHSLHRTPELVSGEVDWVVHLARYGVPVSNVIASANGRSIEVIDGDAVSSLGDDYFIAYAFEKAEGRHTHRADWNDDFIEIWGAVLGHLHRVTKGYRPARPEFRRFHWHEDPSLHLCQAVARQSRVVEKRRAILERLRSLPVDDDSYGLIHADLHHGNFLARDGAMRIFDFDDCHYGWFAFDISIPLFYVLRDKEVDPADTAFANRFLSSFLAGYRRENAQDDFWMNHIPDFLKLREMDLYNLIIADDAVDADDWCQRFMKDRRHRIEHDIPVTELDFSKLAGR